MEELTPPCFQTSSALQPSICCKKACTQCAKQCMPVVDKPVKFLFQVWYMIMLGSPIWRNSPHHVTKLWVPCSQASAAKQHSHSVPNSACPLLINRPEFLFQVWYMIMSGSPIWRNWPHEAHHGASWPVEALRLLFTSYERTSIFKEKVPPPLYPLNPPPPPPPPRKMWII